MPMPRVAVNLKCSFFMKGKKTHPEGLFHFSMQSSKSFAPKSARLDLIPSHPRRTMESVIKQKQPLTLAQLKHCRIKLYS